MTRLLHSGARTHHQDQPMIPASFSATRGITARGSWPGSDSRHDDLCPLVTLRAYPAGGSGNQRELSRERSVLLISANLTGFHFHDLRHTGNILAGASGASMAPTAETADHGPELGRKLWSG
jgi:integrase